MTVKTPPSPKKELRRFLQNRREVNDFMWDVDPPFSTTITAKPYPPGYQPPHFRKFDGIGSAREHIISFLDDLGVHSGDNDLKLREFSKSLTGRAFTWYTKLRSNSINSWE